MKSFFIVILFLISLPLYSQQDSTLIKDRTDIDKNYETIASNLRELQAYSYKLEGAIDYVNTLDTQSVKYKDDYTKLVEEYSKLKSKIVEFQIQLYILQGYREYNELLQQRKK